MPFLLSLLIGCGEVFTYNPLEDKLLRLVDIEPPDGASISAGQKISIKFSRPVDRATVGSRSIFSLKAEDMPSEAKELMESGINMIHGMYSVSGDGLAVDFMPEASSDGEYNIVVTNRLYSADGMAFSSGFAAGTPYVSRFRVGQYGGEDAGEPAPAISGADSEEASGGEGEDGSGNDSVGGNDDGSENARPETLVINEVYYDAPGTDTNGDLFIELYGDPGAGVSKYYIALIDGDDGKTYKTIPFTESCVIGDDGFFVVADTDSSGKTSVPGADLLYNFDPQNGPDTVQLIDPTGRLVDVVGYGNVKAVKAENGLPTYEASPAPSAASGKSISRTNGGDTGDNSADFTVQDAPSPGR